MQPIQCRKESKVPRFSPFLWGHIMFPEKRETSAFVKGRSTLKSTNNSILPFWITSGGSVCEAKDELWQKSDCLVVEKKRKWTQVSFDPFDCMQMHLNAFNIFYTCYFLMYNTLLWDAYTFNTPWAKSKIIQRSYASEAKWRRRNRRIDGIFRASWAMSHKQKWPSWLNFPIWIENWPRWLASKRQTNPQTSSLVTRPDQSLAWANLVYSHCVCVGVFGNFARKAPPDGCTHWHQRELWRANNNTKRIKLR